ncbi:hypothetical protein ACH6EH_18640 [Paenibacillus sp. JSM ZJ436]|uniref:hypothetical protein n=1 Tax=Paenibacillus sp. JSM ZJ436 TaxID=3376190 RepID=UPI0037A7613C
MEHKSSSRVLKGILLCLIVIAFKPYPSAPSHSSYTVQGHEGSEAVVQLAENRIAVVDTSLNSALRGEIMVFEFNVDLKIFEPIGRYNYMDFFWNPDKYNF